MAIFDKASTIYCKKIRFLHLSWPASPCALHICVACGTTTDAGPDHLYPLFRAPTGQAPPALELFGTRTPLPYQQANVSPQEESATRIKGIIISLPAGTQGLSHGAAASPSGGP